MNILYHHRTQGKGGEGVHIREIVMALESLGHKVFVVSPPGVNALEDVASDKAVKKSCIFANLWRFIGKYTPQIIFEIFEIVYNLYAYNKLSKVLKREKIDFIYERYAFFLFAGVNLSKKYHIPIILEVNETSGLKRERGQVLISLAENIEKMVFQKANFLLPVTSFLKQEIIRKGVDQEKIFVQPNAINLDSFTGMNSCDELRRRFAIRGKTILGFVGHFSRWDSLLTLLDIFEQLRLLNKDVHLLIIGDGKLRKELENAVAEKKMNDFVTFSGKVSRGSIKNYVGLIDIAVIPNQSIFGSPLVMFEFMAMGKAIVAPDATGVTDVLVDNISCRVFKLGDFEALKNVLIELIDAPQKRKMLGDAARDIVFVKHRWVGNAGRIINIYNNLKKEIIYAA